MNDLLLVRIPFAHMRADTEQALQAFSQKFRTSTVAKGFQIGLCGVVEADLELFCNCWSAIFLRERLYASRSRAAL